MNNNKITVKITIIGALLFTAIIVFGTILTGRSANRDSMDAVNKVSMILMEEMTARREQVLSSALHTYMKDLDIAVEMLGKDDLASEDKLQEYQLRMKQLYDLDKFAFVDENGVIHTDRGTRTDIDNYDFDYQTISNPEISVKNLDSADKKIVIAEPVDHLPYMGTHLVACFMEIDVKTFLENLSFETKDPKSYTFCNIYTRDGVPLNNVVLAGIANENNLIEALTKADFSEGYSSADVAESFRNGVNGEVSFTYDGISETMYYVPVSNTDWMLTYLIRKQVISDQISSISRGIITRTLAMAIVAVAIIFGFFVVIIYQLRKNAALTLEREKSEAENRVRQEELEEQVALQEELLEQEKMNVRQDQMITALSSDYRSVYYVDLEHDEGICYSKDSAIEVIGGGKNFHFVEGFTNYANEFVDEKYRDDFLSFINPANIREALDKKSLIACRYLVRRNGRESFEMLRMAGVRHPEDREDGCVHAVGVGFSDIDAEMRESMVQSQALADALQAAEAASKAKTTFLSNMSHEIRTPMNAIIGLDSLALHEENIPDTVREYLEKIGDSAQHLLSLINDILDMSRIESGRVVLRNEVFSFPKFLEQINTIISGQCTEKGVIYNCHITGRLDDYYIGDSVKLRQVLINILGNAVKFTPEGNSVDLDVEKIAAANGKSTLRFVIRDTGVGISEEFIPKMFDTFSQEDSSAANKYGSSGLGMAITKNIVDMMNGNIDVKSKKGEGTTFTVTLTLNDSDKKDEIDESLEIRPNEMTVLVVDDDPVACDHAKLVLGNSGIHVEIAASGKEAVAMVKLRHARREAYNLIIIDWQMPEMDGLETTRAIRSEIGDESAIIILTAYNWDDVFDEAKKAGVDSFIAKPLFAGNLLEEFKRAVEQKKLREKEGKKKAILAGRRVLLAEDMVINAQIMVKVLKMKDIITELAENGKVCVDMFTESEEGYYDAILMDMRMPIMTGTEATVAIRKLDREDAKKIPIIALTANAFDEDVQRSLQAGLNAHLSKPVEPELLFETLEELLD